MTYSESIYFLSIYYMTGANGLQRENTEAEREEWGRRQKLHRKSILGEERDKAANKMEDSKESIKMNRKHNHVWWLQITSEGMTRKRKPEWPEAPVPQRPGKQVREAERTAK